jgi:hypothetical protein
MIGDHPAMDEQRVMPPSRRCRQSSIATDAIVGPTETRNVANAVVSLEALWK